MITITERAEFEEIYPPVDLTGLSPNLLNEKEVELMRIDIEPETKVLMDILEEGPKTTTELGQKLEGSVFSTMYVAGTVLGKLGINKPLSIDHSIEIFHGQDPLIVLGDMHIQGDFELNGQLIVVGNLVVEGCLKLDDYTSDLQVTGSITAQHISTTASCIIGGNVKVDGYLFGHHNDGYFIVRGSVQAKAVLSDDYCFEFDPTMAELELTSSFASRDFPRREMGKDDFDKLKAFLPDGAVFEDTEYASPYFFNSDRLFS